MSKKYYKFMAAGCVGPFSGKKLEADKLLPAVEGDLIMCENGYHFCTSEHLCRWANAELYAVEARGRIVKGDGKCCAREIKMTRIEKWNEKSARLFAADCAEQALPIFEKQRPDDDRPRKAIKAARDFANGEITAEMRDAAGDAAGAAARAAAGDAAWAAAWAAARAAAWDAARAAAWDAQNKQLTLMVNDLFRRQK